MALSLSITPNPNPGVNMKPQLRMRRIAQKTSPPLLPPYDNEETCFVWLGGTQGGKFFNSRRQGVIVHRKRAVINKSDSVNRGLMEILDPSLKDHPYRAYQTCRTDLCVNPHHWKPRRDLPPIPPPPSDDWTVDEAQELIDLYLATNTRPLDLTHPLLVDIPPELVRSMGYEAK